MLTRIIPLAEKKDIMAARRGTFAFDLSKPVKKAMMLKQGHFHRAFKHRFFVLYPGFLVYYSDENRWATDITKGETLGSRLGAIKLKNGSCSVCRDPPKGCKFGLIIYAPDQSNKRPTFLVNASSKEDREAWIDAINKSTPHGKSPQPGRKDVKPRPHPTSSSSTPAAANPPPPGSSSSSPPTARQSGASEVTSTVPDSEKPSSSSLSNGSHQNATTASTSDSSTGPSIRHDTANAAALSLSESLHEQHLEKTIPEEEQVTNIDEILGPQATTLEDSSDDSAPTTPNLSDTDLRRPEGEGKEEVGEGGAKESQSTSHSETTDSELSSLQSPPPSATESVQMVIEESVENSVNTHGKLEVVTSVTISVTADDDDDGNDKGGEENLENGAKVENGEKESGGDSTKETSEAEKEEVSRKDSQVLTEVIIPQEEDVNSFSVTVTNMGDSDATSSSDEDDDKEEEEEGKKRKDTEEVVSKPVLNGVEEEEGEASGATALPPSITVDEVEKVVSRTSSGSSSDSSKLVPVDSEKRRASTPFIEKTGFLYKMGGRHKSWKLRFFILAPGAFKYYKKTPNSKPLGEVKLKNLKIFFPGTGERKLSFQFTVHTESSWNKRSNWVMAAQSEREMKDWINAFKLAGQKQSCSPAQSEDEGSS